MKSRLNEMKENTLNLIRKEGVSNTELIGTINDIMIGLLKDFDEAGVSEKREEQFWFDIEKAEKPYRTNKFNVFRLYNLLDSFYTYAENKYNCFPQKITDEEIKHAVGYAEVVRENETKAGRIYTIYFPADHEKLKEYLLSHDINNPESYEISGIYSDNNDVLQEALEKTKCTDVFEANFFFRNTQLCQTI